MMWKELGEVGGEKCAAVGCVWLGEFLVANGVGEGQGRFSCGRHLIQTMENLEQYEGACLGVWIIRQDRKSVLAREIRTTARVDELIENWGQSGP